MAESSQYNLGIEFSIDSKEATAKISSLEAKLTSLGSKVNSVSQKMESTSSSSVSAATKQIDKYSKLTSQVKTLNKNNKSLISKNKELKSTVSAQKKELDKLTNSQKKNTKQSQNWLSSYSESLQIAVKSTLLWGSATTAIYGSLKALKDLHSVMVDVNSEMVALKRVMDSAITNFEEMESISSELGVEYAKNVDSVVKSMVEWGRQGKNQVEVLELTESALLASNVAQLESEESVKLLTAAILQFSMDASESIEVVDKLNEVANNYATTARDLAMSIRESGAAANSAGVSMDELIGMTTALSASTAKSGSRIGRALRTVFSRIMGDAGSTEESLGKVEVALNSIGIAVRSSQNDYRDLSSILTDLSTRWEDLDQVMQSNIARAIGGRRRYSDVISLIENWDIAVESTKSSINSLNSAIKENETYMESIGAQWKQVRAQFESVSVTLSNIGLGEISKKFANFSRGSLLAIEDTIIGLNELEKNFNLVSNALRGLGLVLVSSLIPSLTKATLAMKAFVLANPTVATIAALSGAILVASKNYGSYHKQLEEAKKVSKAFNKVKERGNELTLSESKNISDTISQYQDLTKAVVESSDAYVLSMESVGALGKMFNDFTGIFFSEKEIDKQIDRLNELRGTFPELSEEFKNNGKFVDALITKLGLLDEQLANTVSGISKYDKKLIESTKQGMRETQVLESKADKYFKLMSIQNRSLEQETKLKQIRSNLKSDWYELAAAGDDFGNVLKDIVNKQLSKFGEDGSKVSSTISKLNEDIEILSDAQKTLSKRYQEVGEKLTKQKEAYDEVKESSESTQIEILNESNELNKLKNEYENIEEQLKLTAETQDTLKEAISEFNEGLNEGDFQTFFSNLAEANQKFTDLESNLKDVLISLKDFNSQLGVDLSFQSLKADLLDLSESSEAKNVLDTYESAQNEVLGYIHEVMNLSVMPDSNRFKDELTGIINEIEGLDFNSMGIDLNSLINDWDSSSFESKKESAIKIGSRIVKDLNDSIKTQTKKVDLTEAYDNLLEFDPSKLSGISDSLLDSLIKDFEELNKSPELIESLDLSGINLDWDLYSSLFSEKNMREIEPKMKEVYSDISKIAGIEFKNLEIGDSAQANVEEYEKAINSVLLQALELKDVDVGSLGTEELKSTLKDLSESDTQFKELYETLNEASNMEFPFTSYEEMFKNLSESTKNYYEENGKLLEQLKKLGSDKEILSEVRAKELDLMSKTEAKIVKLTDEINKYEKLLKEAYSPEVSSRIKDIITQLKDQLDVTEALSEIESSKAMESIKNLNDFDINDVSGITESNKALKQIKNQSKEVKRVLDDVKDRFNLSDAQIKDIAESLEFDEKEVEKFVKQLDKKIIETKNTWVNVIGTSINDALNDSNLESGFEQAAQAARNILSGIFSDEDLNADFSNFTSKIGNSLADLFNVSDYGDEISAGLTTGLKSFASGNSVAGSLMSGAGAIATTMGNTITGGLLSGIGAIGSSLWGEVEGEEYIAQVDEINAKQDMAVKKLKEYQVTMSKVRAYVKDTAGWWQSMWGGADYKAYNLKAANEQFDKMQQKLKRLQSISSDIGSSLERSIKNTLNHKDLKATFEKGLGQAINEALFESLVVTKGLDSQIKHLAGQISLALNDGIISASEETVIQGLKDTILDSAYEIQDIMGDIGNIIDTDTDVDNVTDASYTAGTTSNYTYHNQYIVEAGAFLGEETDAETFARFIAPYIREVNERQQGG